MLGVVGGLDLMLVKRRELEEEVVEKPDTLGLMMEKTNWMGLHLGPVHL